MPPLLTIDHHNGVPAYRQIMDQVKFQIAAGMISAGDELPSTRALSAELSLNPMTISKAYSLLEHDGVLERRRGQSLVVRAVPKTEQETNKLAPLRQHLTVASSMASQLGVSPTQALKIFRELLDQSSS